MVYQRQSEVPKKGEPESHIICKDLVSKVLESSGFTIEQESKLHLVGNFGIKNGVSVDLEYGHDYDIHATKKSCTGKTIRLLIEIGAGDDDSRHVNKGELNIKKTSLKILREQQKWDERAELVLKLFDIDDLHLTEVYRLSKDDILAFEGDLEKLRKFLIKEKIIKPYAN